MTSVCRVLVLSCSNFFLSCPVPDLFRSYPCHCLILSLTLSCLVPDLLLSYPLSLSYLVQDLVLFCPVPDLVWCPICPWPTVLSYHCPCPILSLTVHSFPVRIIVPDLVRSYPCHCPILSLTSSCRVPDLVLSYHCPCPILSLTLPFFPFRIIFRVLACIFIYVRSYLCHCHIFALTLSCRVPDLILSYQCPCPVLTLP